MPHIKPIRKFSKPHVGLKGPLGRYIIQVSDPEPPDSNGTPPADDDETAHAKKLNNYYLALKRGRKGKMRLINLEFKTFDKEKGSTSKDHVPPLTSTLTFSDFLCRWCLAYVGQRRQFCSADCASQFRICQRKREQRQDLNISVDYYGNVKLSIQGLPLQAGEESSIPVQKSYPAYGGGRRGRRRKRCRNCAKLLKDDSDEEFCDVTCQSMDTERSKKEDFVNIFQQKEAAERRRIRKWLMDAQDNYSKNQGELDAHGDPEIYNVTSGPAALDPLPVFRDPLPVFRDPLPVVPSPITVPEYTKPFRKDSPTRSGGPAYGHTRAHYVQDNTRLKRDEVITGGPVTLNPTPRRVPVKSDRPPRHISTNTLTHSYSGDSRSYDSDKRQVMIDLKWIPKFYGQQ